MDTLSNFADLEPRFPLSEAGFAISCYETVRHLGLIPFDPNAQFTHSLWLIFEGRFGGRGTVAYLPFDASHDPFDPDWISAECGVVASMMEHPPPDEIALVVLRRPGSAEASEADQHIFHVLCEAVAGRRTAPWWFYVTTPDGVLRVR